MMTLDTVKTLKVQELKDELKSHGLDTKGNKADLVKRLEAFLAEADNEPATDATEEAPAQEAVTIVAEADGPVSEEVAKEITAAAGEALAEQEATPMDTEGEAVELTTTITADQDGTVVVETEEKPIDDSEAPPPAPELPMETVQEAVSEAVEAANTAAELQQESAIAVTTVQETKAQDDVMVDTAVATGEVLAEATELKEEAKEVKSDEQGAANGAHATPTPVRLFVGSVPHSLTEEELKVPFLPLGGLKEVSILRDAVTGNSRGCAFAMFENKEYADQAVAKLDRAITLPGGTQPMEVRYAKETNKIQPTSEPNALNKLFFARAPPTATEADLRAVFSEFGEVTEVAIFQNRPAGTSKGCGFVSFSSQAEAQAAIDNLHDKKTMTGGVSALTVKWADVDLATKKRKAFEEAMDPNRENTQIFFAKIPRTVTEEELRNVFSTVAPVKELVIFKANQAAPTNKGCGIVTLHSHAEATEVLEKLHDTHKLEGMNDCMVLKWVDQDLQKRRRVGPGDEYGLPGRHGEFAGGPGAWGPGPYGPPAAQFDEDMPPRGCAPDAYKLFLANVPKTWELQELRGHLDAHGQIVEMNLVRDKMTREPRGVAFAWYKTKAQADKCVREMDKQVFDHGNGVQKAISVARAKARRLSGGGQGGFGQGPPGAGGYGRPQAPYQAYGPPRPDPYQQPPYQQPAPGYGAYGQQPQAVQQPQYNSYQAPNPYQNAGYGQQAAYSQPGYSQQGAYQQPAATNYNAYQTQTAPQQAAYAPSGGYAQQYSATAQQPAAASYTTPAASTGYATAATGYAGQPAAYNAQQTTYTAPAAQTYGTGQAAQTAYNYAQPAAGQATYGTAGQAQTGQAAATAYNYGQQGSYTPQSTDGGYQYTPQTQ